MNSEMDNFKEIITCLILFLGAASVAYVLFERLLGAWRRFADSAKKSSGKALAAAALSSSPAGFFRFRLVLGTLFFIVGLLAVNFILGVLLASLAYRLPLVWVRRLEEKRLSRITSQLVEAMEMMGSALKSGLNLAQAFGLLVKEFPPPLADEFEQVLAENRLGVEITEALNNMAKRLRLPVVNILATGVSVSYRYGGDLSEIFQHIAETIRARALIEGKIEAVTSLGRFQGAVLSAMPFVLAVVLYFIDPDHIKMLFEYTFGLAAVAAVILLVLAANLWMNRLIRIDV